MISAAQRRSGFAVFGLAAALILVFTSGPRAENCAAGKAAPQQASTEVDLKQAAVATGVLSRMMEATRLVGLDDPNIKVGPLTLLAPSDEAFNALPEDVRTRLLDPQNRGLLTEVLLYHAVPGLYPVDRLMNARVPNYTISAIDGSEIEILKKRQTRDIAIEGARIVKGDVMASDGIIHVIDKVLIPETVMQALMAPPEPTEIAAEGDQ